MAAALAMPPSHPSEPLAFADFGCSEGANSVAQMSAAVAAAKNALGTASPRDGDGRAVTVTHVDLDANPWSTVFQCVAAAPGYNDPPRSFVYAIGTPAGFYAQAFPSGSLSLAHGSATFHWGSSAPASLPDRCLFPWLSSDPAVRSAAATQASTDWATILRHRAAELKPGGRFIASLVAAPPGSDAAGDLRADLPAMWRHVAETWGGMVDDGTLSEAEAAGVVVPVNMSTPAQLLAPFSDASAVGGAALSSLFDVVKAEAVDMAFPQWVAYQASGDAAAYAAALRLFLEAVLKGMQTASIAAARAGQADGASTAAAAVGTFYDRLEAALRADPQPASQTVLILHLERKK